MLGNDISLSKDVKLSYMEGFYFWHAMRLFVCPLGEIAQKQTIHPIALALVQHHS